MKARVKATGEIVEVHTSDDADFVDRNGKYYWEHELFFGSLDVSSYDNPDYWTRLEHQYAGMAMQGLLTNTALAKLLHDDNASIKDKTGIFSEWAKMYATALVEKLKEIWKV